MTQSLLTTEGKGKGKQRRETEPNTTEEKRGWGVHYEYSGNPNRSRLLQNLPPVNFPFFTGSGLSEARDFPQLCLRQELWMEADRPPGLRNTSGKVSITDALSRSALCLGTHRYRCCLLEPCWRWDRSQNNYPNGQLVRRNHDSLIWLTRNALKVIENQYPWHLIYENGQQAKACLKSYQADIYYLLRNVCLVLLLTRYVCTGNVTQICKFENHLLGYASQKPVPTSPCEEKDSFIQFFTILYP